MSKETPVLKNYINGEWVQSRGKTLEVKNPANGKTLVHVPLSTRPETWSAVEAARDAFPSWRDTSLSHRIELVSRLRDLINIKKEEIARLITEGHGKVLADARGEVTRVLENLTFSLNIDLMSGRHLSNIAGGSIEEYSRPTPLGVFCAITPFNFPAMIPFWTMPYALVAGNTFILKPSELVPLVADYIFKMIHEAGFPPGVVNLVHGDYRVGEWLVAHDDVVGVCSVTSTPVMKKIAEQAARYNKRFVCQGGAKNFIVITADVDIKKVVPHILDSVFGNSGQRCLAGSNVVLVGSEQFHNEMVVRLVKGASSLKVGDGSLPDIDMGPVISRAALERILKFIEHGVASGAKLALDGRDVKPDGNSYGYWVGPTIFSQVNPDMEIACDEIFGPVMTVLRATRVEDAVEMINASPYGNAAMVFTKDGRVASRFKQDDVQIGNLGINIALPAPIPPFSFGGMRDSFRGVLHSQGTDMVQFFTNTKVIIERWL